MKFWSGMTKKAAAVLTDLLMIGDPSTGDIKYIEVADLKIVKTDSDQTIAGTKIFSSLPRIPLVPTSSVHATSKFYVDDGLDQKDNYTLTAEWEDDTFFDNLDLSDGIYNYWHGQLHVRSCISIEGVKNGIYQFKFTSSGMAYRRIDLAAEGETQVFPEFKWRYNNDQIDYILLDFVKSTEQELTAEQQAQARLNIGAASKEDVDMAIALAL